MRNSIILPAVTVCILFLFMVAPVQADVPDDLLNILGKAELGYQKDASDYIREANEAKAQCQESSRKYDEKFRAYVLKVKQESGDQSLPTGSGGWDMMLSLSAEDRALLQDSQMMNSFYEDDPSAKLDWLDMQRAAREAEKKYNEAYRLTPSDDYRQHARIFREGAGIYDILGDTEGAGQLREAEEAAIARAEESETINSDCLIVTATFGSPMATEVQLVRTFRDDTVKQNYLGSRYVTALNAMYYSFSPVVARSIDENPSVKPVMRVILAPLISIVLLSQGVYSLLSFSPGIATVVFIIIGGALVGLVYILPVMLPALWIAVKRKWQVPAVKSVKPVAYIWAGLLAALVLGAVLEIDLIAVLSSGLLFACTVFLTAGAVALYLLGHFGARPVGQDE